MVLIKNDLRDVITAIDLSIVTYRRIKFNFAWAFGYNLAGMLYMHATTTTPPPPTTTHHQQHQHSTINNPLTMAHSCSSPSGRWGILSLLVLLVAPNGSRRCDGLVIGVGGVLVPVIEILSQAEPRRSRRTAACKKAKPQWQQAATSCQKEMDGERRGKKGTPQRRRRIPTVLLHLL